MKFLNDLDDHYLKLTNKLGIVNLMSLDEYYEQDGYWSRLAKLKATELYISEYDYHFLYEIQSLSSQIHFGLLNCYLYKDLRSKERGTPNVYNHRYTFMLESTIHGIYSYWNRVGLLLNFSLRTPLKKNNVYIKKVLDNLIIDFPQLKDNDQFNWLLKLLEDFQKLKRNEFAHNNSLIMQDFLSISGYEEVNIDELPSKLLIHNNSISEGIWNLVDLLEFLNDCADN